MCKVGSTMIGRRWRIGVESIAEVLKLVAGGDLEQEPKAEA